MKRYASIIMISGMVAFASLIPAYAEGLEQNGEIAILAESADYAITVNGKALSLSKVPYDKDSHIMLPLREVAQALGFKVEWNNEDNSVSLDDDIVKTRVTIGEDSYYLASSKAIGLTASIPFGVAPEIKEGTAYVPLDLFKLLLGEDRVEIDGKNIKLYANAEEIENVQIPNPFTEHKTEEEAEQALCFKPIYNINLPEGYSLDAIRTMDNNFVEYVYKNGDKEITYRMAEGTDDISGDYNVYEDVKTITINDTDVIIKKDSENSGAIWTNGKMAFSVYCNTAFSDDEIVDIISGVLDNNSVQMPNPFTEYDTTEEAEKAISFKPVYPSYLPSGYKADEVSTMEDNFLQVFYKNGDKEICYRMAMGNDDISGDYNVYDDVKEAEINGLNVTIRRNGETASAIWTKDDNTFSVYSNSDISMEEIVKIISSIK